MSLIRVTTKPEQEGPLGVYWVLMCGEHWVRAELWPHPRGCMLQIIEDDEIISMRWRWTREQADYEAALAKRWYEGRGYA